MDLPDDYRKLEQQLNGLVKALPGGLANFSELRKAAATVTLPTEYFALHEELLAIRETSLSMKGFPLMGGLTGTLEPETTTMWLWWRASHEGSVVALDALRKFVTSNTHDCFARMGVSNFVADKIYHLQCGLNIFPRKVLGGAPALATMFADTVSPHTDSDLGAAGGCMQFLPIDCFWTIKIPIVVEVFGTEEERLKKLHSQPKAYDTEIKPIVALTMLVPGKEAAFLTALQLHMDKATPMAAPRWNYLFSPVALPSSGPSSTWNDADIQALDQLVTQYKRLNSADTARLQAVLTRAAISATATDPVITSAELRIALEILLCIKGDSRIKSKVAMGVAGVLGTTKSDKEVIFSDMRSIYKTLSGAVHGGRIDVTPQWSDCIAQGHRYLGRVVRHILSDGKVPDWKTLRKRDDVRALLTEDEQQ